MKIKPEAYDASSIQVLEGLAPVRMKPGLYIGETNWQGLWITAKEFLDNAFDEASNGYATKVFVQLNSDGSLIVADNGRGIPVDIHPKLKKSAMEVVFTNLHAGGKMDEKSSSYKKGSKGTFGLGASISCALSEYLAVSSFRDGKWYCMEFEKGGNPLTKLPFHLKPPPEHNLKKGTVIEFLPDYSFFQDGSYLQDSTLHDYCSINSHFIPDLEITYVSSVGVKTVFKSTGLNQLISEKMESFNTNPLLESKPFYHEEGNVKVIIQWAESDSTDGFDSYVCGSYTKNGGTHLRGFFEVLQEVLTPFNKKAKYETSDLMYGALGVLDYTMIAPSFGGQTKSQLTSQEAKPVTKEILLKPLKSYFKENPELASLLIERAVDFRNTLSESENAKKLASQLKITKKGKQILPDKLLVSVGFKPEMVELYICEGDSAKGTCRGARDPHQEVLGLRGKVLNVIRDGASPDSNKEVTDILKSIGYNPSLQDPYSKLRVGKILLMADSDVDGTHIRTLLIGLLQTYLPELFTRKMIYDVIVPVYMYRLDSGDKIFADTLTDMQKLVPNFSPLKMSRLKGWGEINPVDLRKVAFLESRNLKLLKPLSKGQYKSFKALLGTDPTERKNLLGVNE
jgi:DNA gyrase subunit B